MREDDRILDWLGDDESRFIYEKKVEYNKTGNFNLVKEVVDRYLPQLKDRPYYPGIEREIPGLLKGKKNVLIFGCGLNGKPVWNLLTSQGIAVKGLVDNDPRKWGHNVWGDDIKSPNEIDYEKVDAVVITPYEQDYIKQIHRQLIDLGLSNDALIINYLDYTTTLLWREQYFDSGIIKFHEDELFVDGGSYDLGTSIRFTEECTKSKVKNFKIHAFEPDPKSYQRCLKVQKNVQNIDLRLYCAGLWSEDTVLQFNATGDGGARIVQQKTPTSIKTVALDNCISDKVTYIKMDIEGAELEALKGSREIIKTCKPRLAICIYHKKGDMIEIPVYIKELVPEYKLYVRHYSNSAIETVLYAVI